MRILPLSLLALAAASFAAPIPPATVLKDRAKLDGKRVEVVGKIAEFTQRTSKKGNRYFLFKVGEGKDLVLGYGKGDAPKALKKGARLILAGRFRKEKMVGKRKIENEIEIDVREKDAVRPAK